MAVSSSLRVAFLLLVVERKETRRRKRGVLFSKEPKEELASCTHSSSGILFRLSLQQCVIKEDTSEERQRASKKFIKMMRLVLALLLGNERTSCCRHCHCRHCRRLPLLAPQGASLAAACLSKLIKPKCDCSRKTFSRVPKRRVSRTFLLVFFSLMMICSANSSSTCSLSSPSSHLIFD